jgi:adenylate cyclase
MKKCMKTIKKLCFSSLGVGLLIMILSCILFYCFENKKPAFFTSIDNKIMDIMFKIRGTQSTSQNIVIIDIDEKSLKTIGQWPWPRDILAKLTNNLYASGARVVGFDIVFPEKDRTSPAQYFKTIDDKIKQKIPKSALKNLMEDKAYDYDALFGDAVASGPSVLGYSFQMKNDGLKSDDQIPFPSGMIKVEPATRNFQSLSLIPAYRAVVSIPTVAQAESEGFMNVFTDNIGTTRQVPLFMLMNNIPYPSLALEIYRVGMQVPSLTIHTSDNQNSLYSSIIGISIGEKFIPTDRFGKLFINYRGPVSTFKYISAVDILKTKNNIDILNKFVIIGSSSTGLFDLRTTPFSSTVPGIEINATIIDNLIAADPFSYDIFTENGVTYTLIIIGGLLLSAILSFLGPLAGSMGALIFFTITITGNYYYFFLNKWHVGITYPVLTSICILICISIFNYFREGKNKRYIQKAFSYYLAPDVVSQLIKSPESLSLKGTQKELTVLFSDIRDFTSISEKMNSLELGNFMNLYLTQMSKIIMDHGGTVDKFIGDAIMAFWGAPKDDSDHTIKAVHTSLLMQHELKKLQTNYQFKNIPPISIGIGINTGVMSVGNFGSDKRFDYTVMGDNVNLASRLEGANKNYGTTILVSKATRDKIKDIFVCRYIDKVQVKGRKQPVDLYEPISRGAVEQKISEEITAYEQGIKEYHQQNFKTAYNIIEPLYKNNHSQLYLTYLNRIQRFIKHPPSPEWKGVERRYRFPVHKLETK